MLIGIIGKTNVGKSTFFKALTLSNVEIANRPFTTIKPNHGIGYVKVNCACKEFNVKCNPKNSFCINGTRFVPVELLDVAGLVPGAHKGKGLGNKFLDDLRQADCFIHILDISGTTNEVGEETRGYDPINDVKFLENEIDFWFFDIIKRNWDKISRLVQITHKEFEKELAQQLSGLGIKVDEIVTAMKGAGIEKNVNVSDEMLFKFTSLLRRISKPMIIAANKIDLPSGKENLERVKKEFPEYQIIPCCSEAELALREAERKKIIKYIPGESSFEILDKNISEQQLKALEFIKNKILDIYKTTGVQDCLNRAVFELLNSVVVYPVEDENKLSDKTGRILPDAYLMPKGSTALDLAFKIHTDIGENFVAAIDCKTKRKIAKDYVLKNGDVIKIFTK
jgi:ribosome-binding ATPase YchF (GTP1/OBG family)